MVAYFSCSSGGEDEEKMREFFGAGQVDQILRSALHACWMALPREKRNVEELKRQMQRLVDRAIRDLEEDRRAFEME
jgi:hypothetical protein